MARKFLDLKKTWVIYRYNLIRQFVYYRCIIKVHLINIGNKKMEDKNEVQLQQQNNKPVNLNDYRNLDAWQNGSLINTDPLDNMSIEQLQKIADILKGVK